MSQDNGPTLLERAQKISPGIAERANWVEEHRTIHPDTMQELVDSGLTRALQSKVYGGEEANPADFYRATAEISRACTSSGWILGLLGVHSWEMAHMGKELNDEVFGADPTTLMASSYAPQGNTAEKVRGGYRLSGRWKSSSGIQHAGWVVLGAMVEDIWCVFFVPKADIRLEDDWFVLGLVGTGSQTVIIDETVVPPHRVMEQDILRAGFAPGHHYFTGALYRMPQAYIYGSVASAPSLGVGRRFYDEYKEAFSKNTTATRAILGDRLMMSRLAEARGTLDVCEIVPTFRLNEAYEAACAGVELSNREVAQGMYDIARNGSLVMGMASTLYPTLRPSAVYKVNIMERLYRDIIVARHHGTSSLDERAEPLAAAELGAAHRHHFLITPEQRDQARERARAYGYID